MVNIGGTPWLYFKLGAKEGWILFQSGTVSTIYVLFMLFPRILNQLTPILGQERVGYYSKVEQYPLFMLFPRILDQLTQILGKNGLDIIPKWNSINYLWYYSEF